jgi:aminoglycoside/choline kinase family phosphotransferase
MDDLRPEIRRYLDRISPGASVSRLAGDASTRRFYRVALLDGSTSVVMDYGAPFQGETDDVMLARLFGDAGLRVASVLDSSPKDGCLLLEDLGDRTLESLLLKGTGARAVLEQAVDLAARIAESGTAVLKRSARAEGPALDEERFRFEMDFFLEHYAGACRGLTRPPSGLRGELHGLARLAADSPRRVLCHRDFHSRNLMVLEDGALAMVDIQDARWGPDSYDLASLLRDAYVDIEESWVEQLVDRYLGGLTEPPDRDSFRLRLARVAAQRMIKALGTFGYQTVEKGSRRYIDAARRTVARLRRELPRLPETRITGQLLLDSGLLDDPA